MSTRSQVEKAFLLKYPTCAACTRHHSHVVVHYIDINMEPILENMVTLCETTSFVPSDDHHLLLGHLGNSNYFNPNVREDIIKYKGWNAFSIRHDPDWRVRHNKLC